MQLFYHHPVCEPDPYFEALKNDAQCKGFQCVVDAIITDSQRRILILRRAKSKSFLPLCWDLPGGHVEAGESLEAALQREVFEEIGVRIGTIDAMIATWDWALLDGACTKRVRQFEFMMSLDEPTQALSIDLDDFSEHRWISESELGIFMENRTRDDTNMLEVLRHAFQLPSYSPMSARSYISVEGVDAVGKTTLVAALKNHFEAKGYRIATKPEFPSSPDVSMQIDDSLKRSIFIGEGFSTGPAAAFFFMLYAEMTSIFELPSSADLLVGDRGLDSLCIYQGAALRGRNCFEPNKILRAMEELYSSLGLRVPECTLLLTLPPQELSHRFELRNGRAPSSSEHDQLIWMQEQFIAVAAQRQRFSIIDARPDPHTVLTNAIAAIEKNVPLERSR